MDIIAIMTSALRESATAALALFAIWSLKKLYEQRAEERDEYFQRREEFQKQRIEERDDYAARLEAVNNALMTKLGEVNHTLGANTKVIEGLQKMLDGQT